LLHVATGFAAGVERPGGARYATVPLCTPAQLEELGREGRVIAVAARERIALDAPTVTFALEGWFRIFRNAAFVRDVTLALAGAGDVLAPGAIFGDRSAENGAEALAPGRLLTVSRERLERFAEGEPGFYLRVAEVLARRASRVERRLEAFSRAEVEARVAGALLELAEDAGIALPDGSIRLDLPLSQEHLAGLAGTTRVSCSSAVAALSRRGLLRGARLRGLVLVDPQALAELGDGLRDD
jgi:CRP-like cAMP-binding protein